MARADFTEPTRRIMAMRAAYRCSNPRCGLVTIGPGAGASEVVNTGTAAHILAAAPGGPRGTGGLSPVARTDIRNGIWLCANCGRHVDANRGAGFPPSLLRSWRDLQEARARIEQAGLAQPIGWISSLTVKAHPAFKPGTTLRLSRYNLIVGVNGSGKTALLDLLRLVDNPRGAAARLGQGERIEVSITWHDPRAREVVIRLSRHAVDFLIDDVRYPLPPRPFRLIDMAARAVAEFKPDDAFTWQGIDRLVIPGVLERQRDRGWRMLPQVHTDGVNLWVQRGDDPTRVPLRRLSGGERAELRLELAFALAAEQALVEPTLLLMDDGMDRIDDHIAKAVIIDALPRLDTGFQTVITANHSRWESVPDWNLIEVRRSAGQVAEIVQADL